MTADSAVVSVYETSATNCVGGWHTIYPLLGYSPGERPKRRWEPCEYEHFYAVIYFWTADGRRWMTQDSVKAGEFIRPRCLGTLWGKPDTEIEP